MLTAEEKMEFEVLRRHGAGIRELARATGWSRNTVRRYLRQGDAAAVRKAAPKRAEKLDPFKGYIVDRVKAAAPDHCNAGRPGGKANALNQPSVYQCGVG